MFTTGFGKTASQVIEMQKGTSGSWAPKPASNLPAVRPSGAVSTVKPAGSTWGSIGRKAVGLAKKHPIATGLTAAGAAFAAGRISKSRENQQ